jgi:dCMP deaminase
MFIAIIGSRFSGKSTVKNYLIAKGFTSVQLRNKNAEGPAKPLVPVTRKIDNNPLQATGGVKNMDTQLGLPSLPVHTNDISDAQERFSALNSPISQDSNLQPTSFDSPALLLDYVTQHWRSNFVTTDLHSDGLVNEFIRRPFFMLISIDAPIMQRYHRSDG